MPQSQSAPFGANFLHNPLYFYFTVVTFVLYIHSLVKASPLPWGAFLVLFGAVS